MYWQIGEVEPWFMAANLPEQKIDLHQYPCRMCAEKCTAIQRTLLRFDKYLVARLFVLISSYGAHLCLCFPVFYRRSHNSPRLATLGRLLCRRDLSIIQIGFRFIQKRLTNAVRVSISLCSYVWHHTVKWLNFDHGFANGMTAFDDLMRLIDFIQPKDIFYRHLDLSSIDQAGSFR